MAPTEQQIAQQFGLASLDYFPAEPGRPENITRSDACQAIDQGLKAVCNALQLPNKGLGTCWREDSPWPKDPQLKLNVWGTRRFSEEGNFAPACGTINLFGTVSSLFHELGHALDFQLTANDTPWSYGETWINALNNSPNFCDQLHSAKKRGGRVRLSDLYLAAPHETFARAFECFIIEKTQPAWPHGPDCTCIKTYPQDAERKMLSEIIEKKVIPNLRARMPSVPTSDR